MEERKAFLNVNEAAILLGLHPETVRRLASEGHISGSRKIGGKWFFDQKAIQDYVRWGSIR